MKIWNKILRHFSHAPSSFRYMHSNFWHLSVLPVLNANDILKAFNHSSHKMDYTHLKYKFNFWLRTPGLGLFLHFGRTSVQVIQKTWHLFCKAMLKLDFCTMIRISFCLFLFRANMNSNFVFESILILFTFLSFKTYTYEVVERVNEYQKFIQK